MNNTNRRTFLQNSALLLAGAVITSSFDLKKKKPLLSFSTLGCPDWSFDKITDFAAAHTYQGIEIRGLQREIDLTKCKEFSPQNLKATMQLMQNKRLHFVGLGSSATMHFREGAERRKNLDEGRRFIDLAQEIDCPYVRVFPNNLPKEQEKSQTLDLISKGLLELADHARGSKVTVLMETHGDLVHTDDLLTVMHSAEHKHSGLVWDITNMWTLAREKPSEVYPKLKRYIRHTHIKDARMVDGVPHYTLLGQGEVPIFEAIAELIKDNYKGYYSFEWEKLWHPEIGEPEIALADFPLAMQKFLNQ
jgi:sugar phosphate isomerase/epimerase